LNFTTGIDWIIDELPGRRLDDRIQVPKVRVALSGPVQCRDDVGRAEGGGCEENCNKWW